MVNTDDRSETGNKRKPEAPKKPDDVFDVLVRF